MVRFWLWEILQALEFSKPLQKKTEETEQRLGLDPAPRLALVSPPLVPIWRERRSFPSLAFSLFQVTTLNTCGDRMGIE
jgi:hypothetical protein